MGKLGKMQQKYAVNEKLPTEGLYHEEKCNV